MKANVDFETQRINTKLSASSNINRNLSVNINRANSDVNLDGRKVGQLITPYVSQTVKVGGI